MEEKLARAIHQATRFKGVSVRSPKCPKEIFYLDDVDACLEIGTDGAALDIYTFMDVIEEMLKNGELELKFNLDKEKTDKHLNFLKKLDVC